MGAQCGVLGNTLRESRSFNPEIAYFMWLTCERDNCQKCSRSFFLMIGIK